MATATANGTASPIAVLITHSHAVRYNMMVVGPDYR